MKKNLLLCFALLMTTILSAQLATWNFEGEVVTPAFVDPTVTAGNAVFGTGVGNISFPSGNGSTDAFSANAWSQGARDVNDYIEFTITPTSGNLLNLTSIVFSERRSGTGPSEFEVRSSLDGFSTVLDSGAIPDDTAWRTQNADISSLTGIATSISIRIYGFNAEGPTGTWRFDDVSFFGNAPLPVELISFTAQAEQDEVLLKWATASEENSDYFAIEHSVDGRSFTEVDLVNAVGFSQEQVNYEFQHTGIVGTNYYRLRQVDFDGRFEYSPVRAVRISAGQVEVKLFPSLVQERLSLQFEMERKAPIQLNIFDLMGRPIAQYIMPKDQGTIDLDFSALAKGHYIINGVIGEDQWTARFIKL